MNYLNKDKSSSKASIASDIAYHSHRKVEFLELNGMKCELSSFFLFALNVLLVYPHSFSYPIFIYIIFQLIYGHNQIKKSEKITQENEAIAKKIYELLLPTLIYYDIDLRFGDYEKYKILISEFSSGDIPSFESLFPQNAKAALDLINKAYEIINEYQHSMNNEDELILEQIEGIISGVISEHPYYENLETYHNALLECQKRLKANQILKRKRMNKSR